MSRKEYGLAGLEGKVPPPPSYGDYAVVYHKDTSVGITPKRRDGKNRRPYVLLDIVVDGLSLPSDVQVSLFHYKTAMRQLFDLMLLNAVPLDWEPQIPTTLLRKERHNHTR